jgi:hypothetical protein
MLRPLIRSCDAIIHRPSTSIPLSLSTSKMISNVTLHNRSRSSSSYHPRYYGWATSSSLLPYHCTWNLMSYKQQQQHHRVNMNQQIHQRVPLLTASSPTSSRHLSSSLPPSPINNDTNANTATNTNTTNATMDNDNNNNKTVTSSTTTTSPTSASSTTTTTTTPTTVTKPHWLDKWIDPTLHPRYSASW